MRRRPSARGDGRPAGYAPGRRRTGVRRPVAHVRDERPNMASEGAGDMIVRACDLNPRDV
ncbi:hypothetical protein [Actinomadura pelletieri]|uniref:hypothetical protein n=1 Tax=Actinomadura pelletieri TaxID=111805 RepID=UPI0011C35759|nr:hypothetical protein [Actinomadura pelletieri]